MEMKINKFEIVRQAAEEAGAAEAAEAGSESNSEEAEVDSPATETSSASSTDGRFDGFQMQDWDSDDESPEEPAQKAEPAKKEEPAKAEAEEKPEAEEKKAEPKAEEKKEAASEEPAKEEKAEEPKAQAQVSDEAKKSLVEQLDANRETVVEELSKLYSVSDEDMDAIVSDPEQGKVALQKLAANLHFNVLRQASALMQQQVPQMVTAMQTQQTQTQGVESAFVERWPELGQEALPQFWQYAQLIASQNPNTPTKDVIEQVGSLLAAQAGKLKPAAAKAAPKPQTPPAFSPAAASAPSTSEPAKPKPGSIESQVAGFELLNQED
jgi:hypothetical protein